MNKKETCIMLGFAIMIIGYVITLSEFTTSTTFFVPGLIPLAVGMFLMYLGGKKFYSSKWW